MLSKINFDLLHDECIKAGRIGICPHCEFNGLLEERILCWCGVCLKYHHDDYFHEDVTTEVFDEIHTNQA